MLSLHYSSLTNIEIYRTTEIIKSHNHENSYENTYNRNRLVSPENNFSGSLVILLLPMYLWTPRSKQMHKQTPIVLLCRTVTNINLYVVTITKFRLVKITLFIIHKYKNLKDNRNNKIPQP